MSEREIFEALLELPDAADRARFLDRACTGNPGLRARVEALYRSHLDARSFLGVPAVERPTTGLLETEHMVEGGGPGGDVVSLHFLSPSTRAGSLGRLGHYEVLELLGVGGFGIVLRASDVMLERVVALKVLAPSLSVNSPARKRFIREARASASVRHENVVRVYAVEEQPLPYIVMEYIPGETLQQRLDRAGPLEACEVAELGRQIASGLAAAHAQGLIHRDIKPGNVLIEEGTHPRVKLTDFGLARAADDASLTQSGVVAGTPMFMSPEQARGEELDVRSDLFSLGSVLYTMCTGHPPFRAHGTLAVLKRVAEDSPRPIREQFPEIPDWLSGVIGRLHEKRREDRIGSASELAELLGQSVSGAWKEAGRAAVAGEVPIDGARQPAGSAWRTRLWRDRRLAAAAGVLLGLAGLGFGEASGVTDLQGTIIRLLSPSGTLVVEVDDPEVMVAIDGEDLVITGAGVREIRLKAGSHRLRATKEGKVVREELVTVASNGRQVVRVSLEGNPETPAGASSSAEQPGSGKLAGIEVIGIEEGQKLAERLKSLNPEFHGVVELRSKQELYLKGNGLTDLSPVADLTGLGRLECTSRSLRDITPLSSLKLWELSVRTTSVEDLAPLKGLALTGLELQGTPVSNLWPLSGMPLTGLSISYTAVTDLTPLSGMPLRLFNCEACKGLVDLKPLKGMNLKEVILRRTRIADLTPLEGMKLIKFDYRESQVTDISVLKGMPLEIVWCDFDAKRDAEVLRSIGSLKLINDTPAEDFWKAVGTP